MEMFADLAKDVPDPFKAFKRPEVLAEPILRGLVPELSPWWDSYNRFEIIAPCTVFLLIAVALTFAHYEKLRKDSKKMT